MPNPPPSPFERLLTEWVERAVFPKMEEALENLMENGFARAQGKGRVARKRAVPPAKSRNRPANASAPQPPRPKHTPPSPTYYDVLEVSPKASVETIRVAYRSLASRFHPDTTGGTTTDKMRLINAAWEVLKDHGKRKDYDRQLRKE